MEFEHVKPMDIEKRSMEIIGQELAEMGISLPADKAHIIKRVIHTSADFDYAQTLAFSTLEGISKSLSSRPSWIRVITFFQRFLWKLRASSGIFSLLS